MQALPFCIYSVTASGTTSNPEPEPAAMEHRPADPASRQRVDLVPAANVRGPNSVGPAELTTPEPLTPPGRPAVLARTVLPCVAFLVASCWLLGSSPLLCMSSPRGLTIAMSISGSLCYSLWKDLFQVKWRWRLLPFCLRLHFHNDYFSLRGL